MTDPFSRAWLIEPAQFTNTLWAMCLPVAAAVVWNTFQLRRSG